MRTSFPKTKGVKIDSSRGRDSQNGLSRSQQLWYFGHERVSFESILDQHIDLTKSDTKVTTMVAIQN
jgi:hypothetical protein